MHVYVLFHFPPTHLQMKTRLNQLLSTLKGLNLQTPSTLHRASSTTASADAPFLFFFEVIRPGRTNYDDTSPCFLFLMNLSCPMLYHLLVDLPNLKHIHHVIIDISSYIPVYVIKQTIPMDGITVHPVLNSLRLTPAAI